MKTDGLEINFYLTYSIRILDTEMESQTKFRSKAEMNQGILMLGNVLIVWKLENSFQELNSQR